MDPQVDRVLAEARARSIDVGAQIGATAYCLTFAVGDALVMRVPRSDFTDDGPFTVRGMALDPQVLLDSSTDRQRALPSFVDRLELAGVPVALHERAIGHPPRREDIPAVARALAAFHEIVPYHGHLAPAHVVVGEAIAFTDVLPEHPRLLGALGYALPIHGDRALRDVAALAAIAAQLEGIELGWTRSFVGFLEDVNRGVSRPWDPQPVLAELYRRCEHGWLCAVGRLAFDHYLPVPSMRPAVTTPREPAPGLARALLVDYERHAQLGALARSLARSPSLLDFVVHERALPIASTASRPDGGIAYAARDVWFDAVDRALAQLRGIYTGAPAAPAPPLAHHPDVAEELRPLRELAIDLDRLLAPLPDTPVGGLLARATANLERLRDPAVRTAAARRYVNYVSNDNRVYFTETR